MVGKPSAFSSEAHGRSSFTWLKDEALLLWHFEWDSTPPPNAVSVIGHDDVVETDVCSMLYADERGVARIYRMSMDGAWRMWRDWPVLATHDGDV